MIVLNLQCTKAHPFEGWFDSTDDFDRQTLSAMVACPVCGDTHIARLPSGPRVKRAATEVAELSQQVDQQGMAQMMHTLSEMAKGSEDVAERFPEEARRMHYGEAEPRNIRGQATLVETRELLEEGIAVLPLPFPAKEDVH
jgi:hypothetical protein